MDILTTHQTAKLLGVSLPTVINWINDGKLKAYRTPGGHRRVRAGDLRTFCIAYELPVPSTLPDSQEPTVGSGRKAIVICSDEPGLSEVIKDFLQIARPDETYVAETALQAGYAIGNASSGVILLDTANFNASTEEFVEILEATFVLVVLASSPDEATSITGANPAIRILSKPLELEALRDTVESALASLGGRDSG